MGESIWEKTADFREFKALDRNTATDVLIIGGGLAGILSAWALSEAGIDCLLIDSGRICRGNTGNTSAKITSQHGLIYSRLYRSFGADTARGYWEANEKALEQYRLLAERLDCDFEEKDNYIYSTRSPRNLEAEMKVLEKLGIPALWKDRPSLPVDTAGAVVFSRQAQFNPLKLASGLAAGLNICENTRALAFEGHTVITSHGKIRADNIIIATHFPIINKHGGYFIKLYQSRSYVMALENAADLDGMYLDEVQGGLSFRNYGRLLLIGGGAHRSGKPGCGWEGLESFAGRAYPKAPEICRWAAQDCITLDGIPYIGDYSPGTGRLYVATGFNKWGMTSSMVSARLLCDMIQGKPNPYARIFSPRRSILHPQLFANAAEATANMLSFRRPRCPHLGCALEWNSFEHSWDCPCHGSRFSDSGRLLDSPATAGLKPEQLPDSHHGR